MSILEVLNMQVEIQSIHSHTLKVSVFTLLIWLMSAKPFWSLYVRFLFGCDVDNISLLAIYVKGWGRKASEKGQYRAQATKHETQCYHNTCADTEKE